MNDTKESVTDALPEPDLLFFDDRLQSPMHGYTPTAVMQIIDTLRAQLAESQRDSERLDWIDQQTYAGAGPRGNVWMVGWKGHAMHGLDFRSAIDIARESK